tara:strand:- start:581 stop:1786 length:1206 start_codon:yes stop_codon:yes gene_type:complete
MLGLGLGTSKGGMIDALALVTNTKSVLFDGSDDHIDCGDITVLNGLGNLTISAWIKVPATGSTEPIFTKIKDDNEGIFFAVNGNHIIFQNEAGSDNYARFDYDDVDDEWHHVAVTFDGSGADNAAKVVMYLDGQSQTIEFSGTFPSATDSDLSSKPLYIGARKYSTAFHPYQGNIDEVAFWNDTLTGPEILQIYNGGSATLDLSVNSGNYSSTANLQGWWRMGDGTLDEHPLVADQTNATLGSELFNGTDKGVNLFTSSGGGVVLTIAYSSEEWIMTGNGGDSIGLMYLSDRSANGGLSEDLEANTLYKITFDAKRNAVGATSIQVIGANSTTHSLTTNYESYTTILKADASPSDTDHYIRGISIADDEAVYIKNISVKKINGNAGLMTNMASDDIESDTP